MEIRAWEGGDDLHPGPPPGGWRPEDLPGYEPDEAVVNPEEDLEESPSTDPEVPKSPSKRPRLRGGWDWD